MLRLFRRKWRPAPTPSDPWALSQPLFSWNGQDHFTIGDAVQGVLGLGETGSGKTTGLGEHLAIPMLQTDFGGLVLTTKPEERAQWERYCEMTGRSGDLVVFGPTPDNKHRLNFLDFEASRAGAGAGLTENIVCLFTAVMELAERAGSASGGGGGRESDGYWKAANRQTIRNATELLLLAKGSVSVPDLYRVIVSAPTSLAQVNNPQWQKASDCFRWLMEGDRRPKSPREARDFEITADYFMLEFPALAEKTRSIIVSTFTSMADVLNRGILRELFNGESTVTPLDIEQGKIVLVDLPIKEYGEVGAFANVLWKVTLQRSIERRQKDGPDQPIRPVFLWADECQNTLTLSTDMHFQSTCRSSRVATVMMTQNLSNVYAALGGGEKAKVEADSLLANLTTKVLHANGDPITNEWASSIIGRSRQFMINASTSQPQGDWVFKALGFDGWGPQGHATGQGHGQVSSGINETIQFEVEPSEFTRLRTGGHAHNGLIDAIVVRSGKLFTTTGRRWAPVTFKQSLR